ncbi:DoxX family protein [Rhizobacter sp. Root404]|uniref:DoxX family protein n=1 Tax=Rhizobacter sp. Root404 TaxID=1736528 RepID=UPI0006F902BB|nr:DoxX family protein [Rhizobacter sp. Root404]KQW36053.1 DoxX family protein [Rhizobacter sp. Root404]
MFNSLQNPLALVGRILLALIFVTSGFGKITGFEGTVGYIASKGLPMASIAAVIAIVIELGGGLAVVFGFLTRWTALALAVFTVIAAFIFHAYWGVPAEQVMMQQINFWKNISIAGGFLVLAAFGPGAISIDAKRGN